MKKKSLALIALGGVLVMALAGCGTTQAPTAADPDASGSTSAGCGDDTTATSTGAVSVTDDLGRTVELDKPAERIAVLEWQQIEDALSLCITPVAVADAEGYSTWVTAEELPEGVTDVGTRQEPNLETLFGTEPDLVIVEVSAADDPIVSQLEVYDVPVLATVGADAADPIAKMLGTLDLIAQVTGREERAAVVADEFQEHLDAASAELADLDLPTKEFVFFDGWVDGGNVALRPFGQGSLVGEIGEKLGLENAWTGGIDPTYGLGQTDVEGMTTVGDASLFYTGTEDPESESFIDALQGNPAWTSLPAVADDRLAAFPAGIWTFGGPRSTQQIIDGYVEVLSK